MVFHPATAMTSGHVWEALRCPFANYVLQKCVTVPWHGHLGGAKALWINWVWIKTYKNTIFRGMTIHKSQLFSCEQKGYYWFWHTANCLFFPKTTISDQKIRCANPLRASNAVQKPPRYSVWVLTFWPNHSPPWTGPFQGEFELHLSRTETKRRGTCAFGFLAAGERDLWRWLFFGRHQSQKK